MKVKHLRAWRERMDFTQVEAADALQMNKITYNKLENLHPNTAIKMARVPLACAAIAAGLTEWIPTP